MLLDECLSRTDGASIDDIPILHPNTRIYCNKFATLHIVIINKNIMWRYYYNDNYEWNAASGCGHTENDVTIDRSGLELESMRITIPYYINS